MDWECGADGGAGGRRVRWGGQPTDLPENVRYGTVATAVTIAEALAQELAAAHGRTAHAGRVANVTTGP